MVEELALILNNYIYGGRKPENFIHDIVFTFFKYEPISMMINDIVLISCDNNYQAAAYDFFSKKININVSMFLRYYYINEEDDIKRRFFYTSLMKSVLHELTHAKQNYILNACQNTLEYLMLKSSVFVLKSDFLNHKKRSELYYFYEMYHDYYPFERDAIINSLNIMNEVAAILHDKYIYLFLEKYNNYHLGKYKLGVCPIERLIKGVRQNDMYKPMFLYESLPFFDEKEILRNVKSLLIDEKERYRWGLYLTPLENYKYGKRIKSFKGKK